MPAAPLQNGRDVRGIGALYSGVHGMKIGGYISEYDEKLARAEAKVGRSTMCKQVRRSLACASCSQKGRETDLLLHRRRVLHRGCSGGGHDDNTAERVA